MPLTPSGVAAVAITALIVAFHWAVRSGPKQARASRDVSTSPKIAEAISHLLVLSLGKVCAVVPELGAPAFRHISTFGLASVYSKLSDLLSRGNGQLPLKGVSAAVREGFSLVPPDFTLSKLAEKMNAWSTTGSSKKRWGGTPAASGTETPFHLPRSKGDEVEVDVVMVAGLPASSPRLARWRSDQIKACTLGNFYTFHPTGAGDAPGDEPPEGEGAASAQPPAKTVSPGDDPAGDSSCYIICEASSDWQVLMQKLVQVERDLLLLAIRIHLKLTLGRPGSQQAGSPSLPRDFVATAAPDLVERFVGLAAVVVVTPTAAEKGAAHDAMRAATTHPRFHEVLPLCATLASRGRLALLCANVTTDVLVAGSIVQGAAYRVELSSLSTRMQSLERKVDVMVDTLATLAADIKRIVPPQGDVPPG